MDIEGQFFACFVKKISTGREKLAPIDWHDWHDWHVFATLLFTEHITGSSDCAQAGRRGEGLAVPGGAGYELVHYTGSPT